MQAGQERRAETVALVGAIRAVRGVGVLATRLRCVDNGQAVTNGIDVFNAASGGALMWD